MKDMEKLKKIWKTVKDLLENLTKLKKNATENEITPKFVINRRLKNQKYAEDYVHLLVFTKIINSIKDGVKRRFKSISSICFFFEVLWKFNYKDQDDIISNSTLLVEKYKN